MSKERLLKVSVQRVFVSTRVVLVFALILFLGFAASRI